MPSIGGGWRPVGGRRWRRRGGVDGGWRGVVALLVAARWM